MKCIRYPRRHYRVTVISLIIISFLALLIFPSTSKDIKSLFNGKDHDLQVQYILNDEKSGKGGEYEHDVAMRNLRGLLGSSPPRCASKCGKCKPCKPVHVPVPPGTPVTAEYYPEAWRCKCGNKLYTP